MGRRLAVKSLVGGALAVLVSSACMGDAPGSKAWSHTFRVDTPARHAEFVGAAERWSAALEQDGFRRFGQSSHVADGPDGVEWERVERLYRGRVPSLEDVRITVVTLDRFVRDQPAVEIRVEAVVPSTPEATAAWESLRASARSAILEPR